MRGPTAPCGIGCCSLCAEEALCLSDRAILCISLPIYTLLPVYVETLSLKCNKVPCPLWLLVAASVGGVGRSIY